MMKDYRYRDKYFRGHFSIKSLRYFAARVKAFTLRFTDELIFYPRVIRRGAKRAFILAQYFTNFRPRSDVTIPKAH